MKCNIFVLLALFLVVTMSFNTAFSILEKTITIGTSGQIIILSNETRPIHIEGKYVKNDLGETVFLRGVNRPSGFTLTCTGSWFQDGGWIYGSSYTHWDETGLRQRLQDMRSKGFNVIRLIIFAEWWIEDSNTNLEGQVTDQSFRYCFTETVRIAEEYGMYVVIAPWASDVGMPEPLPFPSTSIPDQESFVNFWVDVSNHLNVFPNIIYELYNEPAGDTDIWFDTVNATVQAIRENDDDHIIVVQQGYCGSFDWVNDPRIQGSNILYSNHIYRFPPGSTIYGTTEYSTYSAINATLIERWGYDVALNSGKALWIGEIGASVSLSEETTGETSYWRNVLQLLNDWEIGYAAWNWDQLGSGWDLQTSVDGPPFELNERGEILVQSIIEGLP